MFDFPWHTPDCDLEYRYSESTNGRLHFWCNTHGQWTTIGPVGKEVTYHYPNGSSWTVRHTRTSKGPFASYEKFSEMLLGKKS